MKIKPLHYFLFFIVITVFIVKMIFNQQQKNKSLNWQFFIKEQVGTNSELNIGKNLSFDNQSLYFSDSKDTIYSLSQNTGQINWLSEIGNHSPFQVMVDRDLLYVSSFDSHIYCLDKKTGYKIWSFAISNQFWPDTEVVFDENDSSVFFADRAGYLYALDKKTGQEIWKKEFKSIDSKKAFVEKTIHFGFIKQNDDQLIVDHFPSKTVFTINKNNGEIIEQKASELKADLSIKKSLFGFNNFNLTVEQNVINQPILHCFDKNENLLWSYQTENRINQNEMYQFSDRIYYLNADNNLLTSLYIGKNPNDKSLKKNNFKILENFSTHEPYKENSNPQITFELKKFDLHAFLQKKSKKIIYLFKNFKEIFFFKIAPQEKDHYLEFDIAHQENFYQNVFTDVKIEAIFSNQNQQKIKVDGFYYDHNLWKIRAKLTKGAWKWQTKIKTPFWTNIQSGTIEIRKDFPKNLSINGDVFVTEDNEVFFPIGLEDIIVDQNKDGNPLNQLGNAKDKMPTIDPKEVSFLTFGEYLDLYANDAKINIFRYGPDNWAPSIWHDLKNRNNFKMEINGNLQGDIILNELQKRDLKVIMSIFSFYPPYTSEESINKKSNQDVLKEYLDYVIARYAASVDIWELTNEAAPSLKWQNFISDYLAKKDPYHHPITTNLENTQLKNSDLLSTHLYLKAPKNNRELIELTNNLQKKDWKKANLISEFGFKGANYFEGSADLMRKFSWIFTFQKKGIIFWNIGGGIYENPETACIYLGPKERFYLNNLQNFIPRMQFPLTNDFQIIDEGKIVVYSLKDQNSNLLYLLNLDQTNVKQQRLPLKILRAGSLEIINPVNYTNISKIEVNENITEITLPYFEDDLAIKITYQN